MSDKYQLGLKFLADKYNDNRYFAKYFYEMLQSKIYKDDNNIFYVNFNNNIFDENSHFGSFDDNKDILKELTKKELNDLVNIQKMF